jgi:hypothetical protein
VVLAFFLGQILHRIAIYYGAKNEVGRINRLMGVKESIPEIVETGKVVSRFVTNHIIGNESSFGQW